jgi:hypothetical protein
MRVPAIALLLLAGATICYAQGQAIGPGGVPMAPGPSQPRDFTPGGVGPGGVKVAPGRAARNANVERTGPGGTKLAPGPAGSVGRASTLRAPTVAPSSGVRGTIKAKRRPIYRKKKRRPEVSLRIMN